MNNKKYLEIISNKCNSYIALDKINRVNEIDKKEVLVIAGNDSDISLIKNITNNYVVSNSSKLLKKLAKKETSSNNENGVEKVILSILK